MMLQYGVLFFRSCLTSSLRTCPDCCRPVFGRSTTTAPTTMSWKNHSSPDSPGSSSSTAGARGGVGRHSLSNRIPARLVIKSQFHAVNRRFSVEQNPDKPMDFNSFRKLIAERHEIQSIPFTLCYKSKSGDRLPITNDENLRKSFESANPCMNLLIQKKGESWEERFGYGTDTMDRKKKGLGGLLGTSQTKPSRNYCISSPEDFRQVSAIIDVDVVPESQRRVKLCKHGGEEKKLGFYIRDGLAIRLTPQGAQKVPGIFVSRLIAGGLAESSGLIGLNDEVLEVNGIDVQGKTIDQVSDMMIANSQNLIITIKPANQRNTLQRNAPRSSGSNSMSSANRRSVNSTSSGNGLYGRNQRIAEVKHIDAGSDSDDEDIVNAYDGQQQRHGAGDTNGYAAYSNAAMRS
uniref:PDZ domain-containing protein n=1 Tax=Panagrellus redivivus TaxID=6233 RepID=A0A7E4V4Y9_PANRE